jgi:hypothetical protein
LDLREKRALYNGFGDTLTRAVEFVAIPGVFALIGAFLDDQLGTGSLLTVGLAVIALAGVFVRAYYAYEVAMQQQEAKLPWKVHPAPRSEQPS